MNIEKLPKSKVKFSLTVNKDEFEDALDYAFDIVKEKVEVKGFRKGHVPRSLFENKFGVESLYEEALNKLISDKYYQAVVENKLDVVGQPNIDLDVKNIERGKDFSFTCEVSVRPEVELGEYKNIEVKKMNLEVSDKDIEEQINSLLESKASLKAKEDAVLENGDTAIFDFNGFIDGKEFEGGKADNFQLEIGSKHFIPGFEEQMVGLKPGEEKDINVKFPEDYHSEAHRGKDAVFKIKLHEIKVKDKPELTDELVKDLKIENVNTVEEYKKYLKENKEKQLELEEKNRVLEDVLKKVIKNSKFEVPNEMYDYEKNNLRQRQENQAKQYGIDLKTLLQITNKPEEVFEMELAKEAKKKVDYDLIIDAIIKKENFEISDEDVENRYNEFSKMYNQSVEDLKKQVETESIKYDIKYQKVLDLLIDNAKFI